MATPFSRTIRSLQTDNYYTSLAGLLAAIVLAVLWAHWFLTAQITSYEISPDVTMTAEENLISQFPRTGMGAKKVQVIRQRIINAEFGQQALKSIHPGQAAFLRLNGKIGKQTGPLPATVINVIQPTGPKKGTVVLRAEIDAAAPNPFSENEGGEVKIEVEHVTPAALVLRASGLLTETPPLSASP